VRYAGDVLVGCLLPYYWMIQNVPVLNGIRVPVRFTLIAYLGLAVAAAYGVQEFVTRRKTQLVAFVIGCLVFLDFLQIPLSTIPAPSAAAHRAILRQTGPCIVLDAPTDDYFTRLKSQFLQMDHTVPVVTGVVGREPGHAYCLFDRIPHLAGLLLSSEAETPVAPDDPQVHREVHWLREKGIHGIVFHRQRLEPAVERRKLRQLEAVLGSPAYTDTLYSGWVLG
jgi:hypothetical protein